jgi:hypothetical protein
LQALPWGLLRWEPPLPHARGFARSPARPLSHAAPWRSSSRRLCSSQPSTKTLLLDSRFKVGIVLDGWLYPIKDEKDLSDKVNQPIMFINTESFLHEENLKKMATFSEAASDDHERICHVIKGSVHQNHIDAPFVLKGSRIKKMLGMHSDTCPDLVMGLNNKMMVQFIRKHLKLETDADIDADVNKQKHLLQSGFGIECCAKIKDNQH